MGHLFMKATEQTLNRTELLRGSVMNRILMWCEHYLTITCQHLSVFTVIIEETVYKKKKHVKKYIL